MEPIMTTQSLCRDFQTGSETVHALRDINLSIMPGELTLLRGRSGSGKTTLMNLLSTLDRPTAGQILFNGRDITTLPDRACDEIRRKEIGYIFQSVALISLMSAYENVEFSLRISGVTMLLLQLYLRLLGLPSCLKVSSVSFRRYSASR